LNNYFLDFLDLELGLDLELDLGLDLELDLDLDLDLELDSQLDFFSFGAIKEYKRIPITTRIKKPGIIKIE
jgi:hypothetical protein